jgi:hypothetical protein
MIDLINYLRPIEFFLIAFIALPVTIVFLWFVLVNWRFFSYWLIRFPICYLLGLTGLSAKLMDAHLRGLENSKFTEKDSPKGEFVAGVNFLLTGAR